MKYSNGILILGALSILVATNAANAGKKPRGAKSAPSAMVKQKYAGNTWKWENGKSGIYFAKNGRTMAIFKKSVGFGTWSVSSSGTICNKATWHWNKAGPKKKNFKTCWKHVVTKDGELWTREDKKNNWYPASFNKVSKGNKVKAKINVRKKKLGI